MPMNNDFRSICESGDLDTVKTLLERHGSPSLSRQEWEEQLQYGLADAANQGHQSVVAYLLSNGARVNQAALILCFRNANISIFEEFLKHGHDINSLDQFGEPALRITTGKLNFMRWLLQRGADLNVRNSRGVSALGTAVVRPFSLAPAILLSHGAKMEPDLLHRAMRPSAQGGIDMVRFLLDHGADVNHITPNEGSPLHYAAFLGLKDVTQLLLDAGANPNVVVDGETAADVARVNGNMEVYELLLAA